MKEFISELLELLSVCILVVCLSFAAFLFIANVYHYSDIIEVKEMMLMEKN